MGLKVGTAAHGCLERGRKGYVATAKLPSTSAKPKCIPAKVFDVKAEQKESTSSASAKSQQRVRSRWLFSPWDLKDVGDVRCLEGRVIEIHGPVKLYEPRGNKLEPGEPAHRLLNFDSPMPQNYDVEKQGHYSAGRMRPPTAKVKGTPTRAPSMGMKRTSKTNYQSKTVAKSSCVSCSRGA
jgi:hypothetical protein